MRFNRQNKFIKLLAFATIALSPFVQADDLTGSNLPSDPFIRQAIATRNFEPGGAYNLFKLRGTVTNRKNNIQIVPFVNQRIGGLQIEQAAVGGNVTYTAKFSGHHHDEHGPFANYNSKTLDPVTKGSALLGFTSYKFNISGTEVHPADAYDGEQGSGYPAPTGARDEYTYSLGGQAHSVSVVPIDDNRSTQQRLFDRFGNAYNTVTNGVSDAWKQATTHDPNLNRWGNGVDIARAAVAGVGSFADAGAEIIGAGDMAAGLDVIKGTASMNALQRLPYQAQLTAVESMLKADKAQQTASNAYQDWRAEYPNWAVTADVAADIASRAVDRMGKGHHANNRNNNRSSNRNDEHHASRNADDAARQTERRTNNASVQTQNVSSIVKQDNFLFREARSLSQQESQGINQMLAQMRQGNNNPGIGSTTYGNIIEFRHKHGGRIYARRTGDGWQILAYSGKGNQEKVWDRLKSLYGRK